MGSDNVVSMRSRARTAKRYAIRAIAFQLFLVGHIAVRLRHNQQPFHDLRRAPEKYWAMFRRSRLRLPAPIFKLGVLKSHGVVVAPPQIRVAAPSAAA
jgi:hypothetical protein